MVWRGIAGFVLFSAVYFAASLASGVVFSLAAFVSRGWPTSWIPVVSGVVGSLIGVFVARAVTDMVLKSYPAKWIAGLFIAIALAVVISDLAIVPMARWDRWFWTQVAEFFAAACTALYVFWFEGRQRLLKN